jgi:hypothetical protein
MGRVSTAQQPDHRAASPDNGGAAAADVVRSGWLVKRAQVKSRFSFTSYRDRWFVLTRTALAYFDAADTIRRKERGR